MLGEEALLTRLALWAGAPVALPIQYARQDAESLFSPHTKRLAFRMVWHGHLLGQKATLVAEVVVNLSTGMRWMRCETLADIRILNLFGIQSDIAWTDGN